MEKIFFSSNLRSSLQKCFLHCMFNNPLFLKVEIVKHMEIPSDSVGLTEEKATDKEAFYSLQINDNKFRLRFEKRIDEPKEIDVPKVVYAEKKWYQAKPNKEVVVEKVQTRPMTYWILTSIDN